MAQLRELLQQLLPSTKSTAVGSSYPFSIPPLNIQDSVMDDSQCLDKEEGEAKEMATLAPTNSSRPSRKKLRFEVWIFFDHAYEVIKDRI